MKTDKALAEQLIEDDREGLTAVGRAMGIPDADIEVMMQVAARVAVRQARGEISAEQAAAENMLTGKNLARNRTTRGEPS